MYELLGYVRRTGEYQGRPFDNYNLHCKMVDPPAEHTGDCVEVIKVRSELIHSEDLVLGALIDVFYDRFGRVSKVSF